MSTSNIADILPLTPLQQGVLFHSQADIGGADIDSASLIEVYNTQVAIDLSGRLDVARLRRAATALLRRHPNLSACFHFEELDRPVSVIPVDVDIPWEEVDLRRVPASRRDAEAVRIAERDRGRPFDLDLPPLLRFMWISFSDDDHRLVLTCHHILVDGWSMPIMLRELMALYADPSGSSLAPVAPFRNYLGWLAAADGERARQAWADYLTGVEPALIAPGVAARDMPQSVTARLDDVIAQRLTSLCRERSLTLSAVVETVWAVVLGTLLGRTDIVFGRTVSGRPADVAGIESMVGLFINTVPVRSDPRPGESPLRTAERMVAAQYRMGNHDHLGLSEIQRLVGDGDLFDTSVVVENYPSGPAEGAVIDGVVVGRVTGADATHYPLTLMVSAGAGIDLRISYRTEVYDEAGAGRILDRVVDVFSQIVADPDLTHARLRTVSPYELRALERWNQTVGPGADDTVCERISRWCAETPDSTAIVDASGNSVTYADLDRRSAGVARTLAEAGVNHGDVVAVMLDRSAEMVIALLGVLRRGAAFLPIGRDIPAQRLVTILDIAAPAAVVVERADDVRAACASSPSLVCPLVLERSVVLEHSVGCSRRDETHARLSAESAAYVIYTSGSTGEPKGVVATHGGLANTLGAVAARVDISPDDRVLASSTITFDISLAQLLLPLTSGATLIVSPPDANRDLDPLVEMIVDRQPTIMETTPTLWRELLAATPEHALASTTAMTAGEALPEDVAAELRSRTRRVVNLYGPSEASIYATAYFGNAPVPPIGRPLPNTHAYVLDPFLRVTPPGQAGELHLAGSGLARGYLARPGLTAERFVANPFGPGRMYRTGDVVAVMPDGDRAAGGLSGEDAFRLGDVHYRGRGGDQIKLRGFRIELGEIETALRGCAGIAAAAADVRDGRLIGYVRQDGSAAPGVAVSSAERESEFMRRVLEEIGHVLPPYMVPSTLVIVDRMPTTPSGKLLRGELPDPVFSASVDEPVNDTERLICEAMAGALGRERVGRMDDFFALGGDSVGAMQVAARIRAHGIALSPKNILENRTADMLARLVSAQSRADQPDHDRGVQSEGEIPLPPMFRWMLAQEGDIDSYHQSVVLEYAGVIDPSTLRAALHKLIESHPSLRLALDRSAPSPRLVTVEPIDSVDRLALVAPESDLAAQLDAVQSRAAGQLSPRTGDLVRAVLIQSSPDSAHLVLVVHHIGIDGASWAVVLRDLMTAIADPVAPIPLPDGSSFRRWAIAQCGDDSREAAGAEREYWRGVLGVSRLRPHYRSGVSPARHRALTDVLPVDVSDRLLNIGRDVSADEVMLAAMSAAIRAVSDPSLVGEVVCDRELHGRDNDTLDVAQTVGWFTALYPVALPVPEEFAALADPDVAVALVSDCAARLRSAPRGGVGYGVLRHLDPSQPLADMGEADYCFNYLGRFGGGMPERWRIVRDQVREGIVDVDTPLRLHRLIDINAVALTIDGRVRLVSNWAFDSAVLDDDQVRLMNDRWCQAIELLLDALESVDVSVDSMNNVAVENDFSDIEIELSDEELADLGQY